MPTPIIQSNQIAIDPRNGLLYYKDENGNVISASLNWKEQDASNEITTDRNTVTLSHNLVVNGSLTVNGDTATISAQTVTIEDNILLLNSNVSATPSTNAGIEVERGISNNVSLRWNESTDRWEVTNDGTTYYEVLTTGSTTFPASVVTLTGTQTLTNKTLTTPVITGVSPTITLSGDLSGSVTLTNLGNATLNATVINNSVALGTDTTGEYVSRLAAGSGITVSNNSGESATPNISIDTSIVQTRVADISDTEIGYLNGVTSAIQTQIDSKAPIANPTFTGTVNGISKTMVGLGSVDNTADTAKPVSTPQQTALNLKANSATPTFTGMTTVAKITVGGIEIDTTSPSDTHVLKYNSALSKYVPGVATVVAAVDDLTDVVAPAPSSDQVLAWDVATSKWINKTFSASVATLDAIGNVTAPSPSSGDYLKWNGTAWVNLATSYSATVGDGSATSFVLTHNLNTREVMVSLASATSPYESYYTDWDATTQDTITIYFASAPSLNSIKVKIIS
jgi:hypothetical protein